MPPSAPALAGASPSSSPAPGPAAASIEEVNATGKGGDFKPGTVNIRAGQSVEWVNHSGNIHNVTFDDRSLTGSTTMSANESFRATFPRPGSYHYICTFHPGMEGTIVVS
jgi:plastocyanin